MCHTRIKPSALHYTMCTIQVARIALRFTFCAQHENPPMGFDAQDLLHCNVQNCANCTLRGEFPHFSTIFARFQLFFLSTCSLLSSTFLSSTFSRAQDKNDSTHFHLFFCEAAVKRMEKKWVGDCCGIRGFSVNIYCSSPICNISKMVLSLYRTILGVYNEA